jgi:predicted nucleic acid-binding protein
MSSPSSAADPADELHAIAAQMPVVDASVWVAYYHEADSAHLRCHAWVQAALDSGQRLVGPSLVLTEVAASLARLADRETARIAVEHLESRIQLELVDLDRVRARRAADLAGATGVRGADAVYLELAHERGEFLVTLDRQQRERGGAVAEVRSP